MALENGLSVKISIIIQDIRSGNLVAGIPQCDLYITAASGIYYSNIRILVTAPGATVQFFALYDKNFAILNRERIKKLLRTESNHLSSCSLLPCVYNERLSVLQ